MALLNIMLIDDDAMSLGGLKDALVLNNFSVKTYNDPRTAIEEYKADAFDVVITDIKMPEMTGMDVFNRVKEINPEAYVILITGHVEVEDAIEAVNRGAWAYFKKPIRVSDLIESLKVILGRIRHENVLDIDQRKLYRGYRKLKNAFESLDNLVESMKNGKVNDGKK